VDESVHKIKINGPYIYVKVHSDCKNYRVSCNYKYCNTKYGTRLNFIRDISNAELIPSNKYFTVDDNIITIKDLNLWKLDKIELSDNNLLNYYKYQNEDNIIIVFHRVFNKDHNFSVFFSSLKYYSFKQFCEGEEC
jgi:hypothetical protein